MRVLVIDNYDSFTYNLVQALGTLGADVVVVRNDAKSADEALAIDPGKRGQSPILSDRRPRWKMGKMGENGDSHLFVPIAGSRQKRGGRSLMFAALFAALIAAAHPSSVS
ncbi:hypothetical protein K8I61_20495 [bacterium]|nr:hypothetical protein [bacterium]